MRTRALLIIAAGLIVVATQLPIGRWAGEGQRRVESNISGVSNTTYKVDVIFDTAKGVLPGQLVKIAGARVGTIDRVTLTPDYRARIEMRIDRRFEPFKSDASCAIKPEGLVGERFVACSPGVASTPIATDDGRALVPVQRTTLPVSLTDLFEILDAPARDRFAVIIATLGLGTAGRGADANEILRRANPAVASTRRVLEVVADHRRELQSTLTDARTVLGELARRKDRVSDFLDQAARVSARTAAHDDDLADAVRRAPGLLGAAQPALERLHALAVDGTPVLDDLRAAAPATARLLARVRPFAAAATPVARDLRAAIPQIRAAIPSARPVVRRLHRFAQRALPAGRDLAALLVSLRDRGFVENLMTLVYRLTTTGARFDSTSHLSLTMLFVQPGCIVFATTPSAQCDSHYHSQAGTPQRSRRRPARDTTRRPAPAVSAPAPKVPPREQPALIPKVTSTVGRLLDYLLG